MGTGKIMKDKLLRYLIFGNHKSLGKKAQRRYTTTFPAKEDGDYERQIRHAGDDGLLLYLIKRIEKIEERLEQKTNPKNNDK